MEDFRQRTTALLGEEYMDKLAKAGAVVLGLGGVGGAVAEALCRAGVGHLLLVDHDFISITNLNRQIPATLSTVGMQKCQALKSRLLDINPDIDIKCSADFLLPENGGVIFDYNPDFIIDAIDTMTTKLWLAEQCHSRDIPLFCSMGTGNRLDPSQLRFGDIADTAGTGCPLARVMRRELKKRGVSSLRVVYSLEMPIKGIATESENGRHSPGSSPFVPPAAGYLLASVALREFLGLP